MNHGDGGKGSGRRNEDVSKVKSNWDLIDWSVTTSKKEATKMDNYEEDIEDGEEAQEYDDTCTWCGGCGEGDYDGAACRNCHGTGVEPSEKDYD